MARIRTIKPEFFTSARVARLSDAAKLTFVGVWTQCDDYGVARADARILKGAVWPLADHVTVADVAAHLDEMALHDPEPLVERYAVGGVEWLRVVGFAEHQRVNRPSRKRNPAPPGGDGAAPSPPAPRPSDEGSPSAHTPLSEGSLMEVEQGTGNREVEHSSSSSGPYHQGRPHPVDDDDEVQHVRRARATADELGRRDSARAPGRRAPVLHQQACADTRWAVHGTDLLALARSRPDLDPVGLADVAEHPSAGLAGPTTPSTALRPPRTVRCADCGLDHAPAVVCPVLHPTGGAA